MKILIITQKVDMDDPILGFFHRWIEEFAKHFDQVTVICLFEGRHALPTGVRVFSLGKEEGHSRIWYVGRLYILLWSLRHEYDRVFVHMNQEYILLAGMLWMFLNKNIYMWRNHHAGSWLTDLAARFCTKIYCTSRYSYTARYHKTEYMPVGVDLERFTIVRTQARVPQSLLYIGRISPAKRVEDFVEAFSILQKKFPQLSGSIYGDPGERDALYYESLRQNISLAGLAGTLVFHRGVPHRETPVIYGRHTVCVNLSSSGMYDKTIFEAMASGCLCIASNDNLRGKIRDDFVFRQGSVDELVFKLTRLLEYTDQEKLIALEQLREFAETQSLGRLGHELTRSIKV